MAKRFTTGIDLENQQALRFRVELLSSDPVSPPDGRLWGNTSTNRLKIQIDGSAVDLASLDDVTGGAVTGGLWDAQSVVVAITDNSPAAVTLAESTVLGRVTGGDIGALSAAQIRTMLNVKDGAAADLTAAQILALIATVDGPASGLDADTLDGTQLSALATGTDLTTAIDALRAELLGDDGDALAASLNSLREIVDELESNDTDIATILTAQATKASAYNILIGDGSTTLFTVTHSLGTKRVTFSLRDTTTDEFFEADVKAPTSNTLTVEFGTAPATSSVEVTVHGKAD